MGMVAGGMAALAMIGPRRVQNLFGIGALFAIVGGIIAALSGVLLHRLGVNMPVQPSLAPALLNSLLNLILSGVIGYAVTTFFVLSYKVEPDMERPDVAEAQAAQATNGRTAVMYFVPGESEEYDVRVVARGFETVDYPHELPPTLLRPLYTIDLKRKYDAIGHSPYRDVHFRLAQKVQERLGRRYKVYIAFYNDTPLLPDAAAEAVRDGARRIVVLHPRVTNPPPGVRAADLRDTLILARYGVSLVETAPLWNADPLARIFVRRALAATETLDRESVGLIVLGLGHPLLRRSLPTDESNTFQRQNQELAFQKRVRQALIRAGFDDDKVVLAWLRWQHPTLEAAYAQLIAEGCRHIFWIGSGLTADGLITLYDIPERLRLPAATSGVPVLPLGPWNDDDLVAETLVERVKAVAGERVEAAT
jgi:protoheme ferro-lyase